MRKSVAAKKKMRVETPGINIIGHLNHQDTTFDDNRFQNTFAELLDEVCDENRFKLKDVISAFIVSVMEAYQNRLDESFNLTMVGQPFCVIGKSNKFKSWMFQIVKTLPYCYPLSSHYLL